MTAMEKHQRLVLIIAILASFVSFLDGSVVTVALPAIMRDLGGGLVTQQWVVDAYTLTLGALILVAGSLSDLFGRIVVLRVGLILFGIASLLCTFAPTAEFLIIARAVQGIGGALLVPSSLALILSNFSGAAQAKAIGQWTGFTSVAFITGPLVGGLFVDLLSWRLVFAINVIPIAIVLYLLFRLNQKDEHEEGVKIDVPGAILGIFGLGLPVFALIEQSNYGFANPVIWGSLVVGILALAAFLWRERVAKQPMVPLALFRVRNFSFGNITTTLVYGAISVGGFLLAIYLQQVGGYKATFAGLATLPVTVISILLSPTVGSLAGRFGARLFMTVGPLIAGAGFLYYVFFTSAHPFYWTEILPGVILFGLGMTITVAPLTSAILGAIDSRQAGIGSAINNAVSRVAGLIAIAFLGLVVGEHLALGGFRRGMLLTAILLFAGGIVSFVGIRNVKGAEPAAKEAVPLPER
ncbi:MAG: transporter [Microbacteriaceae bacterium]|jgi:EmrB/QacA subfamily drug resistance transporter|nr:transporter [Microbacteriaceae bacterium]